MIHASWVQNKTFTSSHQQYLLRVLEDEFTLEAPSPGDHVLVTKADGSVSEDVLGRLIAEIRSRATATKGKLMWYFEQELSPEAVEVRRRSLRDGESRAAHPRGGQPGDGSRFSKAAEAPPEDAAQQKPQGDADRLRAPLRAHLEAKEHIARGKERKAPARRERDENPDDTGEVPF